MAASSEPGRSADAAWLYATKWGSNMDKPWFDHVFFQHTIPGVPVLRIAMELTTIPNLLALLACIFVLYCICIGVYRLYFSPLAKFPGPRLAALTLWYEFYYDVIKRGRYTWRIAEMHQQYGVPHALETHLATT